MNIQTATVTNLTASDVKVGVTTYPANSTFQLFDANDIATYGRTMDVLLNHFDRIKHLSTHEGVFEFRLNGMLYSTPAMFEAAWDALRPMSAVHTVGFSGSEHFYFNLRTKEWSIRDPLNGSTYTIQMTKVP